MQTKRDQVLQIDLGQVNDPLEHVIYSLPGDIQIKSLKGQLIDDAELGWEFVAYDRSAEKVIMALVLMDGTEAADVRLHELLFSNIRLSDVPAFTSAFLVTPPSDAFTEGWVLLPVESDDHGKPGMFASHSYLAKLLEVAQE